MKKLEWKLITKKHRAIGEHIYTIEPWGGCFMLVVRATNGALLIEYTFTKLKSAMRVAELMENG